MKRILPFLSVKRFSSLFSRSFYSKKSSALTNSVSLFNSTWSHPKSKKLLLATVCGSMVLYTLFKKDEKANACGIIAMLGKEPVLPYLLEGLNILQNRGYDSAGVATIHKSSIITTKFASTSTTSDSIKKIVDNTPSRHSSDYIGIAHTRWATHGGKTDNNAHPHSDQKNRIALVHNGTIENSTALKKELLSKGIKFKSETDTEVIAQLIGYYLDNGESFIDAVKSAIGRLEGTWGLAIIYKDKPDELIAARHGSPLVVGIDKNRMFISSEVTAFSRHTNQYISLQDGEVAIIKADDTSNLDLLRVEKSEAEKVELSPAPYSHWTIKEIMEQPESIGRSLNYGGRLTPNGEVKLGGLERKKELLLGINNLIIAACGTSFYASLYGAQLMRHLLAFETVQPVDAAEFSPDIIPRTAPGLLVISQSGETKDVHRCVNSAQQMNIPVFSLINSVGSLIARSTGVYINAGREHAVASTKAFITQITVLALISAWFSQYRPNRQIEDATKLQRRLALIESIHRLPTYAGMTLTTKPLCSRIAQEISNKEHVFVLGKGFGEPIAREGALKIKEISYIHAEGFPGGALKHGPFALIEKGTPIILLILDDEYSSFMRTAAFEVKGRGAHVIAITDNPKLTEDIADITIPIPSNGPLTALLGVIPLQFLAYELAIKRGIDPDKPKNLAKAVTVD